MDYNPTQPYMQGYFTEYSTTGGEIPPFDPGSYELDSEGIFYRPLDSGRSEATQGLRPSNVLRRYLMYVQRGLCRDCEIPEWALGRSLQIHRLQGDGLYTVLNTVLLCASCHNPVTRSRI